METVCGIPGAHCEIVMLRPPDGGSRLELASFVTPDHVPGSPMAMANEADLEGNVAQTRPAPNRPDQQWRMDPLAPDTADRVPAGDASVELLEQGHAIGEYEDSRLGTAWCSRWSKHSAEALHPFCIKHVLACFL